MSAHRLMTFSTTSDFGRFLGRVYSRTSHVYSRARRVSAWRRQRAGSRGRSTAIYARRVAKVRPPIVPASTQADGMNPISKLGHSDFQRCPVVRLSISDNPTNESTFVALDDVSLCNRVCSKRLIRCVHRSSRRNTYSRLFVERDLLTAPGMLWAHQ